MVRPDLGHVGVGPAPTLQASNLSRQFPPHRKAHLGTGISGSAAATMLSLHGWPAYLVVALLAFGESAIFVGFVLPGETAMVVAGVLAARGKISLRAIIAICASAAVLGDQVCYLLGRYVGPGLRRSRLGRRVGEARWTKAQDAVTRHGTWAVAGGRWVAVLRALVPTVARAIAMPYRRFVLANAVGGSVWAAGRC